MDRLQRFDIYPASFVKILGSSNSYLSDGHFLSNLQLTCKLTSTDIDLGFSMAMGSSRLVSVEG